MVVHVGLNILRNEYFAYDTVKKTINHFTVELHDDEDINEIVKIFEEIKVKVNDDLGCACICFQKNSDSYKKLFVDEGLKIGFKAVQVIGYHVALLYSIISPLDYQETKGINVMITSQFLKPHVYIWQNKDGYVKLIDSFPFHKESIYDDIGTDKDNFTIFYSKEINFCEENFPENKNLSCDINASMGTIYKARMMGNDPDVFFYDVYNFFGTSLILYINEVEVLRIDYGEILPLTKHIFYEMPGNDGILTVIAAGAKAEYTLPQMKKVFIVLEIDHAKDYSIKYLDVSNVEDNNSIYKFLTKKNTKSKIFDAQGSYIFPKKIQVNIDQINAIGIDLGTTRCCSAVNRRNGMETVALENTGGKLLSSWVGFDEDNPKCGQVVVDRLRNYAKSIVFDVKRVIGKDFNEVRIDPGWPFEINTFYKITKTATKYENDMFIKIMGKNMMFFKRAEEVSAVLLKYIKEKAEEFQGKQLTEVVLTFPAAFNHFQKQATYEAAILAGWETVHLLPEPVAAAFAYFIERPIPNNKVLLLFDLGGGTLDVCIFRVQKNQLKIITRSGDPNIGGRDFDNILFEYFEKKFIEDFGIKVTKDKRYKLLPKCQSIKENLSVRENDFLDVEEIDCSVEGFIPLTRNQFEDMSTELLKAIRQNINAALKKIEFLHDEVQMVLHVGGGCRMPMIKTLLQNLFPISEHIREQNVDEVVAVGAAYYAYYLNQKDNKKRNCSVM